MLSTPSAQAETAPVTRTDLDELQGCWTTVAGRRGARLVVAGSQFIFEFQDGDVYSGCLRVNSAMAPRHMDMRIKDGPTAYRGRLALCIYHVEGDVLRWCPSVPGAGYRLARFPSVDDDHYYCLVFRRERSAEAH